MDTIKATPIEQKLEITSNPYVVFTPFGYHPFVNVKNLDNYQQILYQFNIIIDNLQ